MTIPGVPRAERPQRLAGADRTGKNGHATTTIGPTERRNATLVALVLSLSMP
jgi:hypothetical protein